MNVINSPDKKDVPKFGKKRNIIQSFLTKHYDRIPDSLFERKLYMTRLY